MARRKSSRMKKVQPAIYELYIPTGVIPQKVGDTAGELQQYIDLSQVASIVNRRFYRQGLNWAVGSFTLLTQAGMTGSFSISKIATNWQTGGAWEKTFRSWKAQQDKALEEMGAEDTKGAFNDYKIHMDTGHVSAGFGANLLPYGAGVGTAVAATPFVSGEWQHSEVVIPNDGAVGVTNEYAVKMYGTSDASAKSILGGYVFSRARPQSPAPDTPSVNTSWLNELNDVGDNNDEIVVNATDRNDELPYNATLYPGQSGNGEGAQFHHVSFISPTTVGGSTHIQGGNFPCGLIRLDMVNETSTAQNVILQINLVPGPHRGYLCEKMEDF
jgi:hypothetical protein